MSPGPMTTRSERDQPMEIPEPPGDGHIFGRRPGEWEAVLPLLGGLMRGPVHLWGSEPGDPKEAVTKEYVDRQLGGGERGFVFAQLPRDLPLEFREWNEVFRLDGKFPSGRRLFRITLGGTIIRPSSYPTSVSCLVRAGLDEVHILVPQGGTEARIDIGGYAEGHATFPVSPDSIPLYSQLYQSPGNTLLFITSGPASDNGDGSAIVPIRAIGPGSSYNVSGGAQVVLARYPAFGVYGRVVHPGTEGGVNNPPPLSLAQSFGLATVVVSLDCGSGLSVRAWGGDYNFNLGTDPATANQLILRGEYDYLGWRCLVEDFGPAEPPQPR
jgi:hypothetical protein